MAESAVDREYRMYVENPYVWISPFEAYARVNYEIQKLNRDRKNLEAELSGVPTFEPGHRGLIEDKLINNRVNIGAVQNIKGKF